MKQRLRKKLRLREFQEIGFAVALILELLENDAESPNYFWNRLTDFVEANGLFILGAIDNFFIFTNYNFSPRPSIRESERYLIRDWLRLQPEVKGFRIRPPAADWRAVLTLAAEGW